MKLFDAIGKALKKSPPKEPQTARYAMLNRQWNDVNAAKGLSPAKLQRLFEQSALGDLRSQAELFESMLERDAHLYAEMEKRKTAPLSLNFTVEPPRNASAQEKALASYADEVLHDLPDLEDLIKSLMDGVGHGFSALEIEWRREGAEWLPKFEHRPQEWFTLSEDFQRITLNTGKAYGEELQPFSWVLHQHGLAKTGYIGRMALYRVLAWPFLYKIYGIGDFAEFLEVYGLPIIVGRYGPGATPDQQRNLLSAVNALGHDARAIMPQDMLLEIQSITGSGTAQHMTIVEWADKAQSKAILGGTLTSQADGKTSTNALGSVHEQAFIAIRNADCRQIAGTMTRDMVYPILLLNKSGVTDFKRCPRVVFDTGEAEDLAQYADAIPKLVSVGLKIPNRYVHDKLKIPVQDGDEPVLGQDQPAAAPANTPPAGLSAVHLSAASLAQFTPEQQVIEELADKLLENMGSPIKPELIANAIRSAKDPEDLEQRLAIILKGAELSEFSAVLEKALFAADVLGFAHGR